MPSEAPTTAPTEPREVRADGLLWLLLGSALAAVLAIVVWGASPYARYLSHEYQPGSASAQATAVALFLAGWTLMITSMMLPTALGLFRAFARLTRRRAAQRRLQVLVGAGFLGTWVVVGCAFRVFDVAVHAIVEAIDQLEQQPQLIGAATLLLAGGFQFTPLKHRCLTACRSPASFLYRHWRGAHPVRDALRIGAAYGWSCVGCCWAVMLVMFAVGSGSLAWMLGLGAVMAVEKGTVAGRHLTAPLGVALVAAAGWRVAAGA